MVKKELLILQDESKVFKLIGPILVPIPLNESRCNIIFISKCWKKTWIHWKGISKSRWISQTEREEINGQKSHCVKNLGVNVQNLANGLISSVIANSSSMMIYIRRRFINLKLWVKIQNLLISQNSFVESNIECKTKYNTNY